MPRRIYGNDIPELPGWWDSIQNSAEPVINALMQRLRPDAFAGQRMQQMVQQNPQMLDMIANMDDSQRQAFAANMGFKHAPQQVMSMASGQQRLDREERARLKQTLTPQQEDERTAGLFGVRTPQAIAREGVVQGQQDVRFGQDTQKFDWEKEVNAFKIPSMRLDASVSDVLNNKKLEDIANIKALVAKYPEVDINEVFQAMKNPATMTPRAQAMGQIINSDPELSKSMSNIMELFKLQEASKTALAGRANSLQDDAWRVTLGYVKEAEDKFQAAQQNLNTVTKNNSLSKLDITQAMSIDPTFKASYEKAVSDVNAAREALKRVHPAKRKFMLDQNKIDIGEFVDPVSATPPLPPVDPALATDALNYINNYRNSRKRP